MRVVCVHGIGRQLDGEQSLLKDWRPALQDGLIRAGAGGLVADADVGMAFYGDLFRPSGQVLAVGDPHYYQITLPASPGIHEVTVMHIVGGTSGRSTLDIQSHLYSS